MCAKVTEILETAYGTAHPEVAQAYVNYGIMLNTQDQMTKATIFLKAALVISEQLYGKQSKIVYQIKVYLLKVYTKMRKTEEMKSLASQIALFEEENEVTVASTKIQESSEDSSKKVMKVYLGNELNVLDESESSGKTPGEVQKNRNEWSLFLRSPDPDFERCVSTVEFRFHPDWITRGVHKGRLDSNIINFTNPPFVFTHIGWPPIHGLPKEHREALFKITIVVTLAEKFKCDPITIPYELVLPVKTEMATTETTGKGREVEYEFVQENGKAHLIMLLGKSAGETGGWIDRL